MLQQKNTTQLKKMITFSKLTQRQIDIIDLVSKAYSNEEIAKKLLITKETVKTHLKSIYNKVDFSYTDKSTSLYRLKIALLWLSHKGEILNLKNKEILECKI